MEKVLTLNAMDPGKEVDLVLPIEEGAANQGTQDIIMVKISTVPRVDVLNLLVQRILNLAPKAVNVVVKSLVKEKKSKKSSKKKVMVKRMSI